MRVTDLRRSVASRCYAAKKKVISMTTRQQKRQYILDYAPVLKDLAEGYEKCASRIDDMPEPIFEAMFKVATQGDEAHACIAEAIEEAGGQSA